MPRKKTPTLTEAELRLMKIIWELKEATVNDVLNRLPSDFHLAYNTILTTMRILEQKGYLKRTKKSRAHVYIPLVSENQEQSNVLKHLLDNFFDGSPELLLLNLVKNENFTSEDIEQLKKMINDKDKE